jgi:hypothetical protein
MWWWLLTWFLMMVMFLGGFVVGRSFRRYRLHEISQFWLCCGYVAAATETSPILLDMLIRQQEA